jgi:hypothetical protein
MTMRKFIAKNKEALAKTVLDVFPQVRSFPHNKTGAADFTDAEIADYIANTEVLRNWARSEGVNI